MSIGNANDFNIAFANGVTTVFGFTFNVEDISHVKVYSVLDGILTPITTGITITINNDLNGGNVTFSVAPLTAVGQILVRREVPYLQPTEYTDLTRYKETETERALDNIVRQVQQLASRVFRSLQYSEDSGATTALVGTPEDGKVLIFDGVTGKIRAGANGADIENAQANAVAAAASAAAAATSETNAANSAAAAAAALAGIPDNDVVFLTFANSPRAVTNADRGKVLSVDTSGGNVVINLGQISSLTMPFTLRVMKTSGDGNTVTINRGGTDLIGDATSYVIANVAGVYLIGDTDGTPDRWSVAPFGAGAGEVKRKVFNVVTDFTVGAPAVLQLDTPYPASSAGIWFDQDGIIQKDIADFTYNPSTGQITTTGNVEANTLAFQAIYQTNSIPIGVTGDGTVSWAKLASGIIASVAELVSGAANKLVSAANLQSYIAGTRSMVRVNTSNAAGSTNTAIRRFSTVVENLGTDITYADSATLGASFTINTTGVYAISYTDCFTPVSLGFGISRNSTQLTTNIASITAADRLAMSWQEGNGSPQTCAVTVRLNAGDVIRPHLGASSTNSGIPAISQFTITRVN